MVHPPPGQPLGHLAELELVGHHVALEVAVPLRSTSAGMTTILH
jgi:hypothetical protein